MFPTPINTYKYITGTRKRVGRGREEGKGKREREEGKEKGKREEGRGNEIEGKG